ncbi:MAG: PIG-L family deacetylase [Ferruginibacter sp.]|nr:PIG-L family deacetylase [Bacteroidota bacterium]MBX2920464.1 PIG-L family deacetylase [Ferruginibacter sp.]
MKKKTILFIGAHPDDETAISEVLTKYGRLGNKVFIIVATDGKGGTRVTKIPDGDSLGVLRRTESICGCKTLGIEPPIFFGIERLDTKIGTGNYFKEHQRFMDSLRVRIPLINPDIIITAGPDGDTHHSEHIVVGATVTELLLAEGWVERYPLYHFAWKKGVESVDPGSYMDEQYFNVKISYTDEDERKAIEALHCYVTQYTQEEFKEEEDRKLKDTTNTIYFRKFVVMKGLKNDFE